MPQYDLMAAPCHQCLTTKNRIVPAARAAQIIRDCKAQDIKFICHKTKGIACRGVHNAIGGCRAYRMARAFNIPVVEHH